MCEITALSLPTVSPLTRKLSTKEEGAVGRHHSGTWTKADEAGPNWAWRCSPNPALLAVTPVPQLLPCAQPRPKLQDPERGRDSCGE